MTLRLFIVDDHAVLREGLRMILETQPDMRVIGTSADGRDAVQRIIGERPDVVLMDISMPGLDGIRATAQILAVSPGIRVVVLSMLSTREHVREALRAGARGYLLKESLGREVIEAVRRVAAGHVHLGRGVAGLTDPEEAVPAAGLAGTSPFHRLSLREREVCKLLVEGRAPKEIAAALGISNKTVDTYKARLMDKLGVDSLPALVKVALRYGVTSSDP